MSAYKPLEPRPRCRHCQRRAGSRRHRGLCRVCHCQPHIRQQYPVQPGGYAGEPNTRAGRRQPLPDTPTDALPGTEAKSLVLMERVARREQLFHPLDRRIDDVWDDDDTPTDLTAFGSVAARWLEPLERFAPMAGSG